MSPRLPRRQQQQRVAGLTLFLILPFGGRGREGRAGRPILRAPGGGRRSPCGATCTGVGSLKHRTEVDRDA